MLNPRCSRHTMALREWRDNMFVVSAHYSCTMKCYIGILHSIKLRCRQDAGELHTFNTNGIMPYTYMQGGARGCHNKGYGERTSSRAEHKSVNIKKTNKYAR